LSLHLNDNCVSIEHKGAIIKESTIRNNNNGFVTGTLNLEAESKLAQILLRNGSGNWSTGSVASLL